MAEVASRKVIKELEKQFRAPTPPLSMLGRICCAACSVGSAVIGVGATIGTIDYLQTPHDAKSVIPTMVMVSGGFIGGAIFSGYTAITGRLEREHPPLELPAEVPELERLDS